MNLIRLFLLMLFVLLQSMAPLVHAHVNGDDGTQHIHLAEVDSAWLGDQEHRAGTANVSQAGHHSAVVCMPPECRSYALAFDEPALAGGQICMLPREHGGLVVSACRPLHSATGGYSHPYSQAPPV